MGSASRPATDAMLSRLFVVVVVVVVFVVVVVVIAMRRITRGGKLWKRKAGGGSHHLLNSATWNVGHEPASDEQSALCLKE